MNTNGYFSFSRLGLVMKRDLMENWKKNLYMFLGIFLVFLGMYLLIMNEYDYKRYDAYLAVERYIESYVSAFSVITLFFLLYFSSEMMKHMRTKEERTSYPSAAGQASSGHEGQQYYQQYADLYCADRHHHRVADSVCVHRAAVLPDGIHQHGGLRGPAKVGF